MMSCPGMGGWIVGMGIFGLVFFVLLVSGVFLLFRGLSSELKPSSSSSVSGHLQTSKAIEVLEERFARGDIDENEYARRREILLGPAKAGPAKAVS